MTRALFPYRHAFSKKNSPKSFRWFQCYGAQRTDERTGFYIPAGNSNDDKLLPVALIFHLGTYYVYVCISLF